jgi:hypothetical protein
MLSFRRTIKDAKWRWIYCNNQIKLPILEMRGRRFIEGVDHTLKLGCFPEPQKVSYAAPPLNAFKPSGKPSIRVVNIAIHATSETFSSVAAQ